MKILNLNRLLVRFWLWMHNLSERLIHRYAIRLEGGLHPKHRIMNYHQFFVDNIDRNDRVLDIGCGNGALTFDIAKKAEAVTGIDLEEHNIQYANKHYKRPNIEYVLGNALVEKPKGEFSVIVLSNVLEHILDRELFLKTVAGLAGKILIRVPMINRDWFTLFKKEMQIEWRLDKTHFTEYTVEQLIEELHSANLVLDFHQINYGELWSVARPSNQCSD